MMERTAICSISANLNSTWSEMHVLRAEDLPLADARPGTTGEGYKCVLVVVPQETTWPEFMGIRPVLRCKAYHYIVRDQIALSPTIMVDCIDHGCQPGPFRNLESPRICCEHTVLGCFPQDRGRLAASSTLQYYMEVA
jgi:hypothetical protein